mmetsp:Transcript_22472/g.57027  ORF Transcript_22472/g.57027 Transcript_22472/m.57027 type:complete len:401 (-) Transcript_22472:153-1355(-)
MPTRARPLPRGPARKPPGWLWAGPPGLIIELAHAHKGFHHIVCHGRACSLVRGDERLQHLDQLRLNLTREHPPRHVLRLDVRELGVVELEEGEVRVRHVHLDVGAQAAVLLKRVAAAREGVLVHLVLDLLGCVRHVDGRALVRRTHLCVEALKRGKELGVNQRGLEKAELRRRIARQAEVGVLVDRARDEAGHALVLPEDMRERGREGGRGLYGGKSVLPDVVRVRKAKDGLDRRVGGEFLDAHDVGVHGAHVVEVGEDEGARDVEATRDDVFAVLARQAVCLLQRDVLPEEFLVVGELDDERALERVLQPFGEHKGDQVPEVQRLGARAAAGVEVHLAAPLHRVEDHPEVAVREEDAAPDPRVRARVGYPLEPRDDVLRDRGRPKLDDQLGVVDASLRL